MCLYFCVSRLFGSLGVTMLVGVWEWKEISLQWIEAHGLRKAKQLIAPLTVKVDLLMLLRRPSLRILIGLLLLAALILRWVVLYPMNVSSERNR